MNKNIDVTTNQINVKYSHSLYFDFDVNTLEVITAFLSKRDVFTLWTHLTLRCLCTVRLLRCTFGSQQDKISCSQLPSLICGV